MACGLDDSDPGIARVGAPEALGEELVAQPFQVASNLGSAHVHLGGNLIVGCRLDRSREHRFGVRQEHLTLDVGQVDDHAVGVGLVHGRVLALVAGAGDDVELPGASGADDLDREDLLRRRIGRTGRDRDGWPTCGAHLECSTHWLGTAGFSPVGVGHARCLDEDPSVGDDEPARHARDLPVPHGRVSEPGLTRLPAAEGHDRIVVQRHLAAFGLVVSDPVAQPSSRCGGGGRHSWCSRWCGACDIEIQISPGGGVRKKLNRGATTRGAPDVARCFGTQ